MKSLKLAVLALLWCGLARGEAVRSVKVDQAATNVLSLDVVVREVLSNNPSLKAARANWEAMKERIPQARAWENPRMGFDTTAGRLVNVPDDSFTDQKLMFEQTLPVAGKNVLQANAATAEAAIAFQELRRRELDAVMKTRVAYIQLANAYAQFDLNQRNDELLKQFTEISRAKYEAGSQSQADVLSAETELAKLEETAVDFLRDISEAESQLNVLMNRPVSSSLKHPQSLNFQMTHVLPERIEGLALAHRPELVMAQRKMEAAQLRWTAAKRDKIPEPTFRVEVDRYNAASTPVSEFIVGASIPLPWFNRKKYAAAIRENKKRMEEAQHEFEAARAETLGAIRDFLKKLETFHHHTLLSEGKLLELARQTVESKRLSYETDKAGFLDLLMAQRSAQEIESMYWTHLAAYQTTIVEIESFVGVPMDLLAEKQKEVK